MDQSCLRERPCAVCARGDDHAARHGGARGGGLPGAGVSGPRGADRAGQRGAAGLRRDPRGGLRERRAREGGRPPLPPRPREVRGRREERRGEGGGVQVVRRLRRAELYPPPEARGVARRVAGRGGQRALRARQRPRGARGGERGPHGGARQPQALPHHRADLRPDRHDRVHARQLRDHVVGNARDAHPDEADPRALRHLQPRVSRPLQRQRAPLHRGGQDRAHARERQRVRRGRADRVRGERRRRADGHGDGLRALPERGPGRA